MCTVWTIIHAEVLSVARLRMWPSCSWRALTCISGDLSKQHSPPATLADLKAPTILLTSHGCMLMCLNPSLTWKVPWVMMVGLYVEGCPWGGWATC